MARLAGIDNIAARALEVLTLTAVRLGEAIGAEWCEIDLDKALWTIPAARTKAHAEHRVPLSRQVLDILNALPRVSPFVFPGRLASKPVVRMSVTRTCARAAGTTEVTLHGFRSSFRDWAGDRTSFPREIAEAALGHRVGNAVEAAYRRGDALEHRRRLMEAWATFCSHPVEVGGEVVALRA
jgi:integrase